MHPVLPFPRVPRRRTLAALTGLGVAVATPAVLGVHPAQAALTGPGVQSGHNITVTPDIDFVGVYGYSPVGTTVVVEVVRSEGGEDVTIGRTVAPTTTLAKGFVGVEINHGPTGSAQTLGSCWDTQTPDIRPGDRVLVTAGDRTDEVTVDDIHWTGRPVEDPVTHDVTLDGVARQTDGTPIPATALNSGEFRNTTGKYRMFPDVVEPIGTDGGFRVHYRAPYTGSRNRDNLSADQRKAALLGENQHLIGFGDVAPLPAEAQIINGITDASGPSIGCEGSPAGSAALPPRDLTPPTVTDRSPADGATDVSRTADVTAALSEPVTGVDSGGFWLNGPTSTVPASVSYDSATRVATLHPDLPLASGTTYTAHLGDRVADAGINRLAPTDWTFTTAVSSDAESPTLTDRSPGIDEVGVPVSSRVTVTFSEPVTGVAAAGFTLNDFFGFEVPATVSYDDATRTATLTPTQPLAADTPYTVSLGGPVTDAAGNPFWASTWGFTTAPAGAPADTAAPTVTGRTPTSGATGVAAGSAVTATFSEPVTGLTDTNFTLSGPAGAVAATVGYDAATRVATLTPGAPLTAGTKYTAALTDAVQDAAGNALAATSWTFTTATAATPPGDTVAPTVASRTPTPAATGVPLGTAVAATFSEPVTGVAGASFTLSGPAGAVPAAVGYDAPTRVATLTPGAPLTAGTKYTATLTTAVKDTAGNPLAATGWTFTTAATPPGDTVAPTLTGGAPADGATGVVTSTAVTATFSEPVTGVAAGSFTLTGPAGAVPATVGYASTTRTATLTPTAPLAAGTKYTATLTAAVKDTAGNPLAATGWTFTTAATPPPPPGGTGTPDVVRAAPADGATAVSPKSAVTATFSTPVTGVSGRSFTLTGPAGAVRATVGYAAGTRTATLTPAAALAAGTRYTVTLTDAVKDTAGHRLAARTWGFTTAAAAPADRVAPTVTDRTPATGATGVRRAATVTVRFSEPVTGVDRGTLTLTTASGTAVPATVRYDAAGRTATLDPTPTLKAGTRYRVALTTGIRDAAGNRLAATAWTFTTGSR